MQLKGPFYALATFLLVLSCHPTDARPVKRSTGLVTLSLTRVQHARSDVHPHVLLQHHINRSQRRHALMTGQEGPSDDELRANLEKLAFSFPHGIPTTESLPAKRYNVQTVPSSAASDDDAVSLSAGSSAASLADDPEIGFTSAHDPTHENSLGLADVGSNQDIEYFATVQIGNPPRDFRIIMDSGSADFWVGSETNCNSDKGTDDKTTDCGDHIFLGEISSSTFVDTKEQWSIKYGSGAIGGTKVTDDVTLAGLTLKNHTFGVAHYESSEFAGDVNHTTVTDGLMGLARSDGGFSNQRTLTPIEALAKNGLIANAITSYKISRHADGKNDGEITFGGLDESKFDKSTLVTVDNVNKGFWEAEMDTVTVNGADLKLKGRTAVLDTGTPLLFAPAEDAKQIHANIPGAFCDADRCTVPCNTTDVVALNFNGTAYTIDSRDLIFFRLNSTDCSSGIQASKSGPFTTNRWLVGDTFLKNVYFSTNYADNTISLAKLV